MAIGTAIAVGGAILAAGAAIQAYRVRARRENHIRTYMFPRGLFDRFRAVRPGMELKDQQLVARALRQFFLTFHKSKYQRVAMPSQVVDDLWHEFILFTRDYQLFCDIAFGRFLHHTPAVKLGDHKRDNEGLRRVWWFSCIEENINPRKATRLPLLFAIDRKLGIQNGYAYDLHCRRGPGDSQCADSFSDSSYDGGTDGLGCSGGGDSGADGGGDGGDGGCSGGCGGGD